MTGNPTNQPADDPAGHTGFYIDVDGTPAHVLGDPNMDDKTKDAIAALVRAAVKKQAEMRAERDGNADEGEVK